MSAHVVFALRHRALSEGLARELSILMGSRRDPPYRFSIAPEGAEPLGPIDGFVPDVVVIDGKRARQVLLQLSSGSQALRVVVYTQFEQLSLAQALVQLGLPPWSTSRPINRRCWRRWMPACKGVSTSTPRSGRSLTRCNCAGMCRSCCPGLVAWIDRFSMVVVALIS